MRQKLFFGILILLIVGVGVWEYRMDLTMIERTIATHPFTGAVVYIALLAMSVVILPLSSLPLLPLAVRVFGVGMTAILSAIGWWIGCLIAFTIARFGRKYLERFVSLKAIDVMEWRIPHDISFVGIVILRMILPVDVTSFALGLLKHLPFSTYSIASLIGIMPFAFVLSYAGGEIGRGAFLSFALIMTGLGIAVLCIRRVWQRYR